MKIILSLAALVFTQGSFAASLNCTTPDSIALSVALSASVDSNYTNGAELKGLEEVYVKAGDKNEFASQILADATYRPRTNKNRARFNFIGVNATTDVFDGIVHGILLPKVLTSAEILRQTATEIQFRAKVISSTDSYHDGIMEYFPFECTLTQNL